MSRWSLCGWFFGLGFAHLAIACGARSGLSVDERRETADAGADVVEVEPPLPEAGPDAHIKDCTEEGITYIYVVTSEHELLRYNPLDASFTVIGMINCPTSSNPYSMAVDRTGMAYIVFHNGELFKVSTASAACSPTGFMSSETGFSLFGMAFATKDEGSDEALFIADSTFEPTSSKGFGTLDTTTLDFKFIAPFGKPLGNAVEFTGTGDARLYGLFIDSGQGLSHIAQVDKKTGAIESDVPLDFGAAPSSFAFAFWGGDFYVFHAEAQGPTKVTRYRPSDGSLLDVAKLSTHVVGVGVSTCAPR